MDEYTFSASLTEFPDVDEWINNLKKSVGPILSYGICAEFAKLIGRENCDSGLASVIRSARRYSNNTLPPEKFEKAMADAETSKDSGNYGGTIGMLISAIYRGDVSETINLVVLVMCYWQDRPLTEAYKGIMRTINKLNKELEK